MSDNFPATLGQIPNDFTFQGEKKRIHYEATSISGRPLLDYRDENNESRSFSGDEINILETQFGTLVSVLIEQIPDSHVVWVRVLIPTSYLPNNASELPIRTIAIFTTHRTPFVGPGGVNGLQVDSYETLALEGTARLAISLSNNEEIPMSSDLSQFKTASATITLKAGDRTPPTIRYANGSFTLDTRVEGGPLGIVRELDADDRRALLTVLQQEITQPPPDVDPAVLKCFYHLLQTAVIPD